MYLFWGAKLRFITSG